MKWSWIAVLLLAGSVYAENCLPSSDSEQYGIWSKQIIAKKVPAEWLKGKGYKGADALKVDLSKYGKIAVEDLPLEAGKKYRFGAYVRTKNLKFRVCAFLIHNNYWRNDIRSGSLPSDTATQWVRVEYEGVLPPSSNGKYTFALYGSDVQPGGELEISAPFIEPVEAPKESNSAGEKKKIAPGGNILPDFSRSHDGELGLWSRNLDLFENAVTLLPGKGENGSDALHLDCRESGGFRIGDLELIPGETYRFGAYVRTSGLNPEGTRIVIYNYKWGTDISTGKLPADTQGKWQKIESVQVLPKSRNGRYTYMIYVPDGKLEVCKPFIEAVSPKGKTETFPAQSYLAQMKRLYPVSPLLTRVDASRPQMTFSYVCPLPGREADYTFRMRLAEPSGKWSDWKEFPVPADRQIKVSWNSSVPAGTGKIQLELRKKSGDATVLSNEYEATFLEPLPAVPQKRLNNLVTELKRVPLKNGKMDFINPREGWVYIGFSADERNAKAVMDGKTEIIVPRTGEQSETMRYLTRGKHEITISGVSVSTGTLTIRTVPEIMLFPLEVGKQNDKNCFLYDLSFFRKHFWHSANVYFLVFGWNPKTDFERAVGKEVRERGFRLMGSDGFHPHEWMDRENMSRGFVGNFPTDSTDGRAVDETSAGAEAELLNNYAEVCWNFTDYDKFIYLWLAHTRGFLNYPKIHGPLMSGASHIGKGRGKLLMETYVETTPDLASLKKYYELVRKHFQLANMSSPDAPERMMLIMSGLLTSGAWNCNAYPQSDIKYALDYFFHLTATVPEARGLYGVGCYNLQYADEENARWIGLLLRHYAVEGNTEMLSPKYGIQYNPGHVVNGDFKEGLNGWKVIPAEKGSIRPRSVSGYGFTKQRRRGIGYGNGDCVVELVRNAKGPNTLEQTFRNFETGKLYALTFVSADGDDLEKRVCKRSYSFLDAELSGAEILENVSYEFRNPPGEKVHREEIVTRKIVFRALKPEIKVVFRDWKSQTDPGGPVGARRWLNFISVNRYFAGE